MNKRDRRAARTTRRKLVRMAEKWAGTDRAIEENDSDGLIRLAKRLGKKYAVLSTSDTGYPTIVLCENEEELAKEMNKDPNWHARQGLGTEPAGMSGSILNN